MRQTYFAARGKNTYQQALFSSSIHALFDVLVEAGRAQIRVVASGKSTHIS
jgi:hypothetical protein